jgi:squalene-hopene/tetraprenyl-beta-curcumene cyclase
MPRRVRSYVLFGISFLALAGCREEDPPAAGGGGAPVASAPAGADARVDEALAKGRELLLSVQDASGAWGDPAGGVPPNVGYTAMAATAVIRATSREKVANDPAIAKALDWLLSKQDPKNGSISDNPAYVNYSTSAAVGAFHAAKIAKYGDAQVKARDYLVSSQYGEDAQEPLNVGAFPYSSKSPRPADLSNVQFAAQALADAGLPKDHVVWRRIQGYLAKVQNRSETNKVEVTREVTVNGEKKEGKVVSGDDGGSAYAPGLSYADWDAKPDGTFVPRSYGSMTYALLKCLLLAGVDPKDPRVVAAFGWISKNFDMTKNPGMPADRAEQAYYYYVYTAARTLAEYERLVKGPLAITDAQGRPRDWRKEVADALLSRRGADGWWANDKEERWEEGSKVLASSYALTALSYVKERP